MLTSSRTAKQSLASSTSRVIFKVVIALPPNRSAACSQHRYLVGEGVILNFLPKEIWQPGSTGETDATRQRKGRGL